MKKFLNTVWLIIRIAGVCVVAYGGYILSLRFLFDSKPNVKAIIDEKGIKISTTPKKTKYSNSDIDKELEKLK